MRIRYVIAFTALMAPVPVYGQDVFEATYSVQQRGKDIGTEHVILRTEAPGSTTSNLRLEFDGKFPANQETLRGTLVRGNTGALDQLQLEVKRPNSTETLRAVQRGNRIYITTTGQGSRGGKEIAGGSGVVLLDEQLQALLLLVADVATAKGTQLTAIYPRSGQKANIVAKRVDGGPKGAVVELSGDLTGRMQLDSAGRVERMELPQAGIIVTKLPS